MEGEGVGVQRLLRENNEGRNLICWSLALEVVMVVVVVVVVEGGKMCYGFK